MRKQKQKTSHYFRRALNISTLVVIATIVVLSLVRAGPARAAPGTNQQLNYQARLLTAQGAVVPDGLYNIEFKIYQDGNGVLGGGDETLEWTETRTGSNKVTVKNGYFSVYLGSVTPFGSSVDWNQDTLWLSVNIGGTATPSYDGEMSPFTRLSSAPYAINSRQLGGLTSDNFVQLAQGQQTDDSANASIHINDTGGGNLLHLLSGGVDKFTVNNSGAIAAATALDTINGIIINGGSISGVAGYTQDSGNFDASASSGTFQTSSGAVSLNGDTSVTGVATFSVVGGLTTLGNGLSVTSGGFDVTGNSTLDGTLSGLTGLSSTGTITLNSFGSTAGLLEVNTAGVVSLATAGTDYEVPLTFNNGLTRSSNTIGLGGTLGATTTIDQGSNNLIFDGTGHIGIGGSPSARLHIKTASAIPLTVESTGATAYAFISYKGTGRDYRLGTAGASESLYGVANKFFVFDATAGAMRLIMDTSGNLNIGGDTTPNSLFSVGSTSQFQVDSTGAIAAATGITSSGNITFSGLNSTGIVTTNGSGQLATGILDRNSSSYFNTALSVANGGTGAATFASNGVLFGNTTGAIQATAAGSPGQVLLANGSNVPTFTTLSGDVTVSSAGVMAIQPNSVVLATDTTGAYVATVSVGNGLSVSGVGSENATATINLDVTVSGATSTQNTLSGLELTADGLSLIRGCSNGELLEWQGTTTGWECNPDNTFSDSTLKTNVATHASVLDSFKDIRIVDYNYKCEDALYTYLTLSCDEQTGVVAQELALVFPELVSVKSGTLLGVNYKKLQTYTILAVSELAQYIEADGDGKFTTVSTNDVVRLTNSGALQNITALTVNGTTSLTGATTLSGGTISLNANATQSVNINTGTSTGTTTIGGGLSSLVINSTAFDVTSGGAVSGVSTLSASGNINTSGGGYQTGGTTRLTNGGALQNITGLTVISGGASITGATTISGGAINLNAGGLLTDTNINTGLSTGTVTIGGGLANLVINSAAFDVTSAGAVSGVTTLSASGNISTTGVYQNDGLSGVSAGTCASNNYLGGLRVTGGIVTAAGSCNGVGLSDERLKANVAQLNSSLQKIRDINLVTFDFKCDHQAFTVMNETCKEGTQTGVLAQQLATVFPELVYEDEFGYMRVKYDELNIYTLRAVQDLAGMLRIEGGKLVLDTTSQNGFSVLGSDGEELFALDADGNAMFSGNVSGGNTVTSTNVLAAIDQRLQEFRLSSQTFSGVVAFSNDVNFSNFVRFAEDVEYAKDVYFKGRPIFNNDTAGFAVIESGDTEVKVTFNEPYSQMPVINVSNTNGNYAPHTLTDIDETGFTIKVQLPAVGDVKFNWTAFVADQAVTYLSGDNPED